jgi:large subunit ribosomal protein L19
MKASIITKETVTSYGQTERGFPSFNVGDRIIVSMIIQEKNTDKKAASTTKERIQKFEGDVIGMRGTGVCQTFKVRKIGEAGIGIEIIFPYYSPSIDSIDLIREGKVRRAKLNYLREKKSQKAAKIKSKSSY